MFCYKVTPACASKWSSDRRARSVCALALRRRLQKQVPLPQFLGPRFVRRVQRHHRTALAAVRRPMRQFRTVGIAVPDEIHPVARREFRQRAIGVLMQPRKSMEIVEYIEKLAGMKRAGVTAVALAEPALRR